MASRLADARASVAVALTAPALLLPVLSGCSVFGPKLEAPDLRIVGVEIVKSDLFEQRLKARMRVQNPNARSLDVRGLTYTIEVGGEEFGRGMSGNSFSVPAMGEAEFDMIITANMAGTLLRLASKASQGTGNTPEQLDYRIVGKVSLASGMLRTIPFEEKGSFRLK
jgi:LEA14-like dessication related protein